MTIGYRYHCGPVCKYGNDNCGKGRKRDRIIIKKIRRGRFFFFCLGISANRRRVLTSPWLFRKLIDAVGSVSFSKGEKADFPCKSHRTYASLAAAAICAAVSSRTVGGEDRTARRTYGFTVTPG